MRKRRIVLGLALLIGGGVIHGPASAQQYRGTAEQQMACTPDVWRLCGSEVPDHRLELQALIVHRAPGRTAVSGLPGGSSE